MSEVIKLQRKHDYPVILKMVNGETIEVVDIDAITEEQFKQFCRDTGTEWFQRLAINAGTQ